MNRTSLAVLIQIAERVAARRLAEAAHRRATVVPIQRDITKLVDKEKIA